MRFTQHYSECTVPAPSRLPVMPGQYTRHTFIRGNKKIQTKAHYPLETSAYKFADDLPKAGCLTGAFGKWVFVIQVLKVLQTGVAGIFYYNGPIIALHYYPYNMLNKQEKVMLVGKSIWMLSNRVIKVEHMLIHLYKINREIV